MYERSQTVRSQFAPSLNSPGAVADDAGLAPASRGPDGDAQPVIGLVGSAVALEGWGDTSWTELAAWLDQAFGARAILWREPTALGPDPVARGDHCLSGPLRALLARCHLVVSTVPTLAEQCEIPVVVIGAPEQDDGWDQAWGVRGARQERLWRMRPAHHGGLLTRTAAAAADRLRPRFGPDKLTPTGVNIEVVLSCIAQGWFETAAMLCAAMRRIAPDCPGLRHLAGVALCEAGHIELGLPHIEAAITAAPAYLRAQLSRARYLLLQERYPEAEAGLTALIDRAPDLVDALVQLALLRWSRHELVSALALAERAYRLEPQHPSTLHCLSLMLFTVGDWARLLPHARLGRATTGGRMYTAFLVDALLALRRWDEAGAILAQSPSDLATHNQTTRLLLRQGRLEDGARHLDQALGLAAAG